MRFLDRSNIPSPSCLQEYQQRQRLWSDVSPQDKAEIRQRLEQWQQSLCAYCEGALEELGKHVEHFRQRSRFPERTFCWENLFLSCERPDSCGKYKDQNHIKNTYSSEELLDPSQEDPDRFFYIGTDGHIAPRTDLSPSEMHRAYETLRILNLNNIRLCRMRNNAVSTYLYRDPDILLTLEDMTTEERKKYIDQELQSIAVEPFSAIIRHLLSGLNS